jgi:hypothetical protein
MILDDKLMMPQSYATVAADESGSMGHTFTSHAWPSDIQ